MPRKSAAKKAAKRAAKQTPARGARKPANRDAVPPSPKSPRGQSKSSKPARAVSAGVAPKVDPVQPVMPANREKPPAPPVERTADGKFPPGVSGNPSGRPKSKPMTDAFRIALATVVPGDPQKRTYGEVLAMAAITKAVKGSYEHLREITDRVEGRSTQRLEHTGADGGPIDISNLTPEQRDAEIAALAADLGYSKVE